MSCYSREQIEDAMAAKGYKYFDGGDFDVNIIGVRNSETKNRVTNAFDDCITLSYREDGEWKMHCYKCTTDPGSVDGCWLLAVAGTGFTIKPMVFQQFRLLGL